MSQSLFHPGDRVIATVEINHRIPCHPSHDQSGELKIWTVAQFTRGTVAEALTGRRDASGEAVGYVAVAFDSVIWHDPEPEYSQLRYLCVAQHQLHKLPYSLGVGETPLFELQVCRRSRLARYICQCARCRRAYELRMSSLAMWVTSELSAEERDRAERLTDWVVGQLPGMPETLAAVLEQDADSGRYRCGVEAGAIQPNGEKGVG